MKKTFLIASMGLALIVTLSGCRTLSLNTPTKPVETKNAETSQDNSSAGQTAGLPNPASENCLQKGGKLEMRKNKKGEYGVCIFEDNKQCEEWAFFHGDCPKGGVKITGYENDAEIYCAITGGQVEGVGTETPMCKRIDGTYCNAQANLDGECPDPYDPNPNAGNIEI